MERFLNFRKYWWIWLIILTPIVILTYQNAIKDLFANPIYFIKSNKQEVCIGEEIEFQWGRMWGKKFWSPNNTTESNRIVTELENNLGLFRRSGSTVIKVNEDMTLYVVDLNYDSSNPLPTTAPFIEINLFNEIDFMNFSFECVNPMGNPSVHSTVLDWSNKAKNLKISTITNPSDWTISIFWSENHPRGSNPGAGQSTNISPRETKDFNHNWDTANYFTISYPGIDTSVYACTAFDQRAGINPPRKMPPDVTLKVISNCKN